jgi:hypothetical protein
MLAPDGITLFISTLGSTVAIGRGICDPVFSLLITDHYIAIACILSDVHNLRMPKQNLLGSPNIQLLTAMMPANSPPSYQRVPTTTSIDLELEDRSGYTKPPIIRHNGQEIDHTSTSLAVNTEAEGSRSRRLKPTRYFWVPERPIGGPALSILADPADSMEVSWSYLILLTSAEGIRLYSNRE